MNIYLQHTLFLLFFINSTFFFVFKDNQHQRQCIRARVNVPNGWGYVDIFTTHLSLSERARDASVQEMWKFIKSTETNTTFQILLGDFNAEPDTDAIKYLQGKYLSEGASIA